MNRKGNRSIMTGYAFWLWAVCCIGCACLPARAWGQLASSEQFAIDSLKAVIYEQPQVPNFEALYQIGLHYVYVSHDSAMQYAQQALDVAQTSDHANWQAMAYYLMGKTLRYSHNYAAAYRTLLKAYPILDNSDVTLTTRVNINREMGHVYYFTNNFQEAQRYYEVSADMVNEYPDPEQYLLMLESWANLYKRSMQYDQASVWFARLVKASDSLGISFNKHLALADWAYIKLQQDSVEVAIAMLNQATEYFVAHEQWVFVGLSQVPLAEAYIRHGRLGRADSLLDNAIANLRANSERELLYQALLLRGMLEERLGNAHLALNYYKEGHAMQNSLVSKNLFNAIADQSQQYEAQQEAQRAREQQSSRLQQRITLSVLALFIIVLLVAGIQLGLGYRARQRKTVRLQTNHMQLREMNDTLSQSQEELYQQREALANQNKQLELQREELEGMNALKDRMISIISHDFRSPLNSLRGVLPLLQDKRLSPKQLEMVMKDVKRRINGNLGLIENLLQWTRAQLMGIGYNPIRFELGVLVTEVKEVLAGIAEEKSIALELALAEGAVVWADRDMVMFIIRNLVANGLKFTHAGGFVRVTALKLEYGVEVSVQDSGVGMKADQVARLFEAHANRSSVGTAQEKGTGLGLLLCQQFAKEHGSEIHVESTPGKGTRFSFLLPFQG